MHSNVTTKNVSWPHFNWATLYIEITSNTKAIELRCPPHLLNVTALPWEKFNYYF